MTPEQMQCMLEKGLRAPSADNLQPWKFQCFPEQNHAELFLDPSRSVHFCDAANLIPHLACGAFIENVRIAATKFGYHLKVDYFPDPNLPEKVAHLFFQSASLPLDPHDLALDQRATNRKFYDSHRKISGSAWARLQSLSLPKDFRIIWLRREDTHFSDLARLIGNSDQLRFEIKRLHEEFMSLLRFDSKENQDGLLVDTLESGISGKFLFRWMKRWETMKQFNRFGLSRVFNLYARKQMLSSQAAGLLIGPPVEEMRGAFLQGGQLMERVWHELTLNGLSVQPMEALPIFEIALRYHEQANEVLTPDQTKSLSDFCREFRKILKIGEKPSLIFFFRIGYSPKPSARSGRRAYSSFLVDKELNESFKLKS